MAKVKICGITNQRDAKLAVSLGAWALGFIFFKKSPRYISPLKARKIIAKLPPLVIPVGVFVNEKIECINKTARICGLRAVQLHGRETPDFCNKLKGCKIIKAFRVGSDFDLNRLKKFKVDFFLFDSFKKNIYGGSGKTFNWKLLKNKRKINHPFILSGGLNKENIKKAISNVKPYAVDISSGVESSPGKKSEKLMKTFFKSVKPYIK